MKKGVTDTRADIEASECEMFTFIEQEDQHNEKDENPHICTTHARVVSNSQQTIETRLLQPRIAISVGSPVGVRARVGARSERAAKRDDREYAPSRRGREDVALEDRRRHRLGT